VGRDRRQGPRSRAARHVLSQSARSGHERGELTASEERLLGSLHWVMDAEPFTRPRLYKIAHASLRPGGLCANNFSFNSDQAHSSK
jgi:hypothetical protein